MSTSVASSASCSGAPLATPVSPRAMSPTTPSAWLFANDSLRASTMRGALAWLAMRERASRRSRVLPMPGRARDRDDDGRLVVDAPLEGRDDLRELGLATHEGRAADVLAPTAQRRADHGAAVAAELQLVAPARQLGGRRVREHLSARGVARERRRAVDDLAGRPRAVDARAARRDRPRTR